MRKPDIDLKLCSDRRKKLAELTKGTAVIIPAHPELIRNNDVHYDYRQDSNLYYLTGFEEPESVLVFRPGMDPETVVFVRPKDELRETWDGFRYGPEGAKREFGFDKTYLTTEIENVLPDLLVPVDKVYYSLLQNTEFDVVFNRCLDKTRSKLGRSGLGLKPVHDTREVLGEVRLIKTAKDVELQRKACEISADGHIAAMRFTKPGVSERQVEAVLRHAFLMQGSPRMGYNPIVASGAGATTLHYVFNDQICRDGDLLLVDAGTEWNYFTGDITRTYPVNGKFTDTQRLLYSSVLTAQKEILKMIRPGVPFKELQETTIGILTEACIEMGLIKNKKETAIESLEYKKYYPHGVSHWLGMDVHDWGAYTVRNESRPLTAGMMFTVEPGLYIPANDESAPKEFRGLGVRIEDNVLVTETGHLNLTSKCPKEISDLESIIGRG
jgi:Xaa-Pro aminopeptidase